MNIGNNNYCDDTILLLVRHFPDLERLVTYSNKFGWEGVTAFANNLTNLKKLLITTNRDAMIGIGFLGKLQNLLNINLRTYDYSGYHLPGYWGYRQLTHQLSQRAGAYSREKR